MKNGLWPNVLYVALWNLKLPEWTECLALCSFSGTFSKVGEGQSIFKGAYASLIWYPIFVLRVLCSHLWSGKWRQMICCSDMIGFSSSAAHLGWIFSIRVCLSVCMTLSLTYPTRVLSVCVELLMSRTDSVTTSEIKMKCQQAVQSETHLNGVVIPPPKLFWNEWVHCVAMHLFMLMLILSLLVLRLSFFCQVWSTVFHPVRCKNKAENMIHY